MREMKALWLLFGAVALISHVLCQPAGEKLMCSDFVEILKEYSDDIEETKTTSEADLMIQSYIEFEDFACKKTEDDCKDYKENIPFIIHMIWKKMDTPSICATLEKMREESKDLCLKCKRIVDVIEYHESDVSEKERGNFTEWFCKVIAPTSMQPSLCKFFAEENKVMNWIEEIPKTHPCHQSEFCSLEKSELGDIPGGEKANRDQKPLSWKLEDVILMDQKNGKDMFIKLDVASTNKEATEQDVNICHLPPKTGMCRAYFIKYFYNSTSGKCEDFVYGGCQGNENKFESMEECSRACDPKLQPESSVTESEEKDSFTNVDDSTTMEKENIDNSEEDEGVDTSLPQYDFPSQPSFASVGELFRKSLSSPLSDYLIPDPPAYREDNNEDFMPDAPNYPEDTNKDIILEPPPISEDIDDYDAENSEDVDEEISEDSDIENPFEIPSDFMETFNKLRSRIKDGLHDGFSKGLFGRNLMKPKFPSFAKTLDANFKKIQSKMMPDFDAIGMKMDGLMKDLFGSSWIKEGIPFLPESSIKIFGNIGNTSFLTSNGTTIECVFCRKIVGFIDFRIKVANETIEFLEKQIKAICSLFPISDTICQFFVDKLDLIVQLIEKGLSPDGICIDLKLCQEKKKLPEGMQVYSSITPTSECSPLCNFMKGLHEDGLRKTTEMWNESKRKLEMFCADNKILVKCKKLIKIFEKATLQLSTIEAEQEEEHCNCFPKQPILEAEPLDVCLRCKQFHKGMVNEMRAINETIQLLASSIVQLCEVLDDDVQSDCFIIAVDIQSSFDHMEEKLVLRSNVCPVIGYCETKKENKTTVAEQIKKHFGNMKSLFSGGNPFLLRGAPIGFRKFSTSCLFCKDCMKNLEKTISKVNETDVKNVFPSIKEGFSLSCETKANGDEMMTVCKKISNGMETVYKVMKKSNNGEGTCKMLGVC